MRDYSSESSRWRSFIGGISVEPTLCLYMMAFMTTSVIERSLFIYKSCSVNHNFNHTVCDNLNSEQYSHERDLVNETTANFLQWNNIASHLFTIILALFMGAWSDKRGRKLPLIIGLTGKLYYSVMIMVNSFQDKWPVEYIIYTATLPMTLTGADVIIFAACYSYLTDITSVKDRTLRITILDVCYLTTMPTGVALGKYLFYKVFNKSYTIMFGVNACLMTLSLFYSLISLKWQTTDRQIPLSEAKHGFLRDFFDKRFVTSTAATVFKKRSNNRRIYLLFFIVIMILYTFQRDEKDYSHIYLFDYLKWDTSTISNFRTFQSTLYVIAMLLGVPLLNKLLELRDTIIIMIGALSHASARAIFALATTGDIFYIGAVVSCLGPITGPAIRSLTSKIVAKSERGQILSVLSVADNAAPVLSSVLFAQFFKHTFKSSIYWLTFTSQVLIFVIIMCVHLTTTTESITADETDEEKKEININDSS